MMNHGCGMGLLSFSHGGGLMWIIILILAAIVIYFLVNKQDTALYSPKETPLDIIKKRYARGELSKNEFEEMKEELGGDNHA